MPSIVAMTALTGTTNQTKCWPYQKRSARKNAIGVPTMAQPYAMNASSPRGASAAAMAGRQARPRHAAGTAVTRTARITMVPALRVTPATPAHSAAVSQ